MVAKRRGRMSEKHIEWFEPEVICRDESLIVVAGPRACGKTYLMATDLCARLRKNRHSVHLVSPLSFENCYHEIGSDIQTHDWSVEQCLSAIFKLQQSEDRHLLILDDADNIIRKSRSICDALSLNKEKSKTSCVVAVQCVDESSKPLFCIADYAFVSSAGLFQQTWQQLCRSFRLKVAFSEAIKHTQSTKSFTFFVFVRSKDDGKEGKLFLYRAAKIAIGSRDWTI